MIDTILDELSANVGAAFAEEGYDASHGRVRLSDRPDLAQFQCNGALAAAKAQKQNPKKLGESIAARLAESGLYEAVTVAGPGFINLVVRDAVLNERILSLHADDRLGGWSGEAAETIVIDYGGPNVAKPLHVGHLRSAIIGEALKRLFRFIGDDVTADIHLGDWGLPMGQLITALEIEQPDLPYFDAGKTDNYPDDAPISLSDLERLYPTASAACKADPQRAAQSKRATAELQDGRPGYRALWTHFIRTSRASIEREYADLGVTFDWWKGESDADHLIDAMAEGLRKDGVVETDDGAEIIRVALEDDKKEVPPLILFKSDGSVLYGTTDLATIIDRRETLNPDRILYVVDQRQALHFEQVFRAADKAGIFPAERLEHIGFGTMNGKDGKPFKTREGGVLKLRDLIEMVEKRAFERITESELASGFEVEEAQEVMKKVAVAALKFADLSNPRMSDYIFDIDRFTSFEGKTGPYLLYASVRVRSVLRKAEQVGAGPAGRVLIGAPEERDLALTLLNYGPSIKTACKKRMPHYLCEHAFSLAQSFSKFYAACRIKDEPDPAVRASRLTLTSAAGRQLDSALGVLGIGVPERM